MKNNKEESYLQQKFGSEKELKEFIADTPNRNKREFEKIRENPQFQNFIKKYDYLVKK